MTITPIKYSAKIKSVLLLIFAFAIVGLLISIDGRMHPTYKWERVQIDKTQFEEYSARVSQEGTSLLSEIYFNEEKLIYDQADNTFYYSAVDNEDGNAPIISIPSQSLRSVLFKPRTKAYIYQEDKAYKLVIKTKTDVSVSNLVITALPVMNINVSIETVENLNLDDTYPIEDYQPVQISLYDNNNEFEVPERLTVSQAKIHMRGGTTISAPQKSYRLSLLEDGNDQSTKTKKNLLGLREDDDWILFSAYSDYEKIRTVFSMNLWHDMAAGNNEWNAPISNEYKYIELFINNRYHGLYALTYPIDKKQFNLSEEENLFKKKDWSGTEFSQDLEPMDSGELWLPGYSLEEGDMSGYEQLHKLYYEMAYSGDTATIRKTCDVGNAIDLWLFYKLTQAVDNIYTSQVKNLYSATKLSNTGIDGYKLLLCPWDMDQTFGNRFVDGQGSHGITSYYNSPDYDLPIEWSPVYFLMNCGDAEIVSQMKERYAKLRETSWSDEAISKAIADYEDDIYNSGAFERTMNRWPDGNYYSPEVKLDDFEAYVLERLKYMDEYVESL